ncbi:Alpha/Beta hydrolase protein [Xylariales sp. PMI_506]|nr:Alpha/Beta hydrolase protein [Xylariales sp. PMI_506]
MHYTLLLTTLLAGNAASGYALRRASTPVWETLPGTPDLPSPISTVTTTVNGVQLWMQKYNEQDGVTPIIMDHGGLGYSAYFGDVISHLVAHGHYVIAVDRRGHGRSTFLADDTFTYEGFAQDISTQLQAAGVPVPYNVVGWSDGGATTLAALLDPVLDSSIAKAFLFGTFSSYEDTNSTFTSTSIYTEFVSRCATEYAALQPRANFTEFAIKVGTMENTLPTWADAQLAGVNGSKVTIVGAEHDEAVNLAVPARLHASMPGSSLVMLTGVSHFAPMQDPEQFTAAVEAWLLS